MEFILPPLAFNKNSLTPFISQETIEFHYEKHHRGYVEKLNQELAKKNEPYRSLEEIVCTSEGKLFNYAAQAWNHSFLWHCLSQSNQHNTMSEDLESKIVSTVGSIEAFQKKFNQVAQDVFGTGWCWLVKDPLHGNLKIIGTVDAETPITKGLIPLLVCDMWEHAYYLDYRNSREKYLAAFWKVVNWEFVSDRFHDTKIINLTTEMLSGPEISAGL